MTTVLPVRGEAATPIRDHHVALLPTLFGAAAILGGATALAPLVEGFSWLQPLTTVVGVIWLIGVGARLTGLPGWVAPAAQLIGLIAAVTALFAPSGIAGWTGASWQEGRELLGFAWEQVMTTVPPAPVTTALSFLITLTVGLLALLVDLLIAATRLPALTAIPLLALYSVPASIARDLLPWYAFVLPMVCYAGILASSRSARLPAGSRATVSSIVTALVITALAIGGATAITQVATGIGTDGRIPHSGRTGGDVSLNPWALLRGDLTARQPSDVLSVSGADRPDYLRTLALERWVPDRGFVIGAITPDIADFDGAIPQSAGEASLMTAHITSLGYRDKYLPIYLGTEAIDGIGSGWAYDASLATVFRNQPTAPGPYAVTLPEAIPAAGRLEADHAAAKAPELTAIDGVSSQTVLLAKRITAGARTDFDKVSKILDYFTDPINGFTYSLATAQGNSGSALTDFLTERTGYCEQYAAAMAVMVRALGIPARVGMGFTQGELQADGSYLIQSTNAHAWVEVPFIKAGWVTFDPTPPVDGQGGLQGFESGGAVAEGGSGPTETSTPAPTSSGAVPPIPQRSQSIPDLDEPGAGPATATEEPGILRAHLVEILVIAAILIGMGLLIAAPRLVRGARRRRRMRAAAAGGPEAAEAAWQEISDTADDHGITFAVSETARDRTNILARQAHLTSTERASLKSVVTTVERSWYGGGAAEPGGPGAGNLDGGASDAAQAAGAGFPQAVTAVAEGLARTSTRTRWDRFWPRSIRPGRS